MRLVIRRSDVLPPPNSDATLASLFRTGSGHAAVCHGILVVVSEPLFSIDVEEDPAQNVGPSEQPIRDDQVHTIREAFTAAGIESQERRQEIAQSCVVRPLASLRELTAAEAHRVLKRIKGNAAAKPRAAGASEWDLREEDTWIDKL